MTDEISPYEWLAREFDRLAILRKMWSAGEVAAIIRRHDIERNPPHDPTNPFAPRERPQKPIRLMTDAERRAAGLEPNGGFDGPTGAD